VLAKMVSDEDKRVLVFGTFDPLHKGHSSFFEQAAVLGNRLIVVVARDETIRQVKDREPTRGEQERMAAVRGESAVDEVILGDAKPQLYEVLNRLDFEVLAMGYDQEPGESEVVELLRSVGKSQVEVVRLEPWEEKVYKSSKLRK